ncbi:MAG: hypothetical protein AMXMBFR84_36980 [Candidatus Hydrogenedentota bacterium]
MGVDMHAAQVNPAWAPDYNDRQISIPFEKETQCVLNLSQAAMQDFLVASPYRFELMAYA